MSTRWAVLLRGINVGGHGKLPMADLRATMPRIGARNVATYIQSGNIVFDHDVTDPDTIANMVRGLIAEDFNIHCYAIALNGKNLASVIDATPQPGEVEGKNIYVVLTPKMATEAEANSLSDAATQGEAMHMIDAAGPINALVLVAPNGIGRSKVAAPMERWLDGDGTTRNLNSLRRIAEMMKE